MASSTYTDEMLQFLEQGFPKMGVPELTKVFNDRFGTHKTNSAIRSALRSHYIRCGRGRGDLNKGKSRLVTPEQAEWLKEQYKHLSRQALTDAFNQHWGTSLKMTQVVSWLRNNRIYSGRNGQFGTRPAWNAGTKGQGICKANSGSFTTGHQPENSAPMYAERETKDGYIEIKVPRPNPWTGRPFRWMAKHRWLWERANGSEPPEGHAIVFKDSNRRNFDLNNLACVSRHMLSALNMLHYSEAPVELRPSIWTLAELDVSASNAMMAQPGKSQTEIILEELRTPSTSRQISDRTRIKFETVACTLSRLRRQGRAKKIGKTTDGARSNRPSVLWILATPAPAKQGQHHEQTHHRDAAQQPTG